MKKNYLYLANWKMNMPLKEALSFAATHSDELSTGSEAKESDIVLCPSAIALYPLSTIFKNTPIATGGQDCSNHTKGSFTGQTSAQCLHEAGATYCIIGHSERRAFQKETDEEIAQKFVHLIDFDLSPVLCIGENWEQHQANQTLAVLESQLAPLFTMLATPLAVPKHLSVCIAYEPVWSIGTGNIATNEHLDTVFTWIEQATRKAGTSVNWRLIYGGSVNESNAAHLKEVEKIGGFLIGGASCSYEKLMAIIRS